MRNLIKDKSFIVGFILGHISFLAVNFYTVNVCKHCTSSAGFPLLFYVWNEGNFYLNGKDLIVENRFSDFYFWNIIADVLIAITFSFIIGLIFKFIWSKFTSKQLK